MIYRFRVVLDNDTKEDIFRDIEIRKTDSLEDLHNVITQSFGFDGSEMASFYISDDDWNQGEEISLFDMSEGGSDIQLMNETTIDATVSESNTKLIYVYDFLSMWTFLVELAEVVEEADGTDFLTYCLSTDKYQVKPQKRLSKQRKMKMILMSLVMAMTVKIMTN